MALELDPSGLTTYTVVDQRRSLATVLTMVGAHITAITTGTCRSYATTPASQVLISLRARRAYAK